MEQNLKMTGKRLDKLFSLDSLRQKWEKNDATAEKQFQENTPCEKRNQNAMNLFNHLQNLIHQRFSNKKKDALDVMMDELKTFLSIRFPKTYNAQITIDDKKTLNADIEETLNGIEDIVEAFELHA